MKDYYQILGLPKNASELEIKNAYRKLSKKFHPDVNDGDFYFENMFKQILEAYETLSNFEQRKIYDLEFLYESTKIISQKNILPTIEVFEASKTDIYSGESFKITWKVFNADKIYIDKIGQVDFSGTKTIRLNNLKEEYINLQIIAENTVNQAVAAQKSIRLRNKLFADIREKIIQEISQQRVDEKILLQTQHYMKKSEKFQKLLLSMGVAFVVLLIVFSIWVFKY
ncbi:MAG: J domain-containing protein [Bacteroidetes bacterium]|nr:MAG: J domain-containing protein [Bacteroidota bacterium]